MVVGTRCSNIKGANMSVSYPATAAIRGGVIEVSEVAVPKLSLVECQADRSINFGPVTVHEDGRVERTDSFTTLDAASLQFWAAVDRVMPLRQTVSGGLTKAQRLALKECIKAGAMFRSGPASGGFYVSAGVSLRRVTGLSTVKVLAERGLVSWDDESLMRCVPTEAATLLAPNLK